MFSAGVELLSKGTPDWWTCVRTDGISQIAARHLARMMQLTNKHVFQQATARYCVYIDVFGESDRLYNTYR